MFLKKITLISVVLLAGCVGIPENVKPVVNFKIDNYLGQWYEIARLDHSFERGLTNVNAEYSLRNDNSVKVINRGYSPENQEWKEVEGKAYFVNSPTIAHLKVSFFEPFYSSYIIFDLDENYRYSLVSGYDKSYFWILSKDKKIDDTLKNTLIKKANDLGFD
ncbi:MAG: lipocalin family protein, partial [Methylococcales bacterium]|nr:lipocalin family protein [Methylococcales bacterium]